MAKTSTLSADAALYEADFYLWVERQAELLRKSRFRDLDLAHLIEEVEDLGASQRNEVFGRSQRIMQHLLKLQFSPATEPRAGWEHTVDDQRDRLELTITASLRAELERTLAERYARSRRRAAKDLARYGDDSRPAGGLPLHGRADSRPRLVPGKPARHRGPGPVRRACC